MLYWYPLIHLAMFCKFLIDLDNTISWTFFTFFNCITALFTHVKELLELVQRHTPRSSPSADNPNLSAKATWSSFRARLIWVAVPTCVMTLLLVMFPAGSEESRAHTVNMKIVAIAVPTCLPHSQDLKTRVPSLLLQFGIPKHSKSPEAHIHRWVWSVDLPRQEHTSCKPFSKKAVASQ